MKQKNKTPEFIAQRRIESLQNGAVSTGIFDDGAIVQFGVGLGTRVFVAVRLKDAERKLFTSERNASHWLRDTCKPNTRSRTIII